MADFCRDCVRELWRVDATDFPPEPGMYLCEGCGWSFFDGHGFRQATPTFSDMEAAFYRKHPNGSCGDPECECASMVAP